MHRAEKMERKYLFSGLVSAIKGLEGSTTTIDLRNDAFIVGTVDHVDGYMNVIMKDAVLSDQRGNQSLCDLFFIKQRNIRYIHIPIEMDVLHLIHSTYDKIIIKSVPRDNTGIGGRRRLQYHKETLARVRELKQRPKK